MTSVPAPSTVATVVQLLAVVVASSCITLHSSSHEKQIRLEEDETPPSQEEIDVARMAKEMDGVAVKRDEFEQHVRFSRTLLVLLSSLTMATSVAEVGFVAAYANRPWARVVQEQMAWPVLSGALLWSTILYLAFHAMAGNNHWFIVVTVSCLATTVFLSDLALIVIPDQANQPFQLARLLFSAIATACAINIPSGPLRVLATKQGTRTLARISTKGRTVFSTLWFSGAIPLIWSAQRKEQLDESDAPLLGSDVSAHLIYLQFCRTYDDCKGRSRDWLPTATLRKCWPLLRAIIFANKHLFIAQLVLAGFTGVVFYAPSYVTFRVVSFLEEQERQGHAPSGMERLRFGLPYCLLLAATTLVPALMMGQLFSICLSWLRTRIRAQLNTSIFAKSLRRKDASAEGVECKDSDDDESSEPETSFISKTQVVNLASVDSEVVSNVVYLVSFTMAPVEILTGGFFAIKLLGWGAVIGLIASLLIQPIIFYLGKLFASYQGSRQASRDRKVTLLNEIFQAVRMVKFNAWERQMAARVGVVRDNELKYQRYIFMTEIAQSFIFRLSPVIVTLVAYSWYTLVEKRPLTPSVAFTAMAVLDEMRYALTHIPEGLTQLIQALVSVQRIQEYLEGDEVEIPRASRTPVTHEQVQTVHASIEWPQASTAKVAALDAEPAFKLTDVSIQFAANSLNLIVGKLGSGKTLLLRALLGEAELVQGTISCPRSLPSSISIEGEDKLSEENWLRSEQCSYVPQSAFLINASLQDNVLFGLPMLRSRYQATLDACGLLPDLVLLEDGDETEIGENGIGLSGGQKTRVCLARAVYSRGATMILDDCLSAVDAHTAEHIHKNLLRGPLFAKRTVILVTHQVQLVAQSAARIVMLEGGTVRFQGEPMAFMNSDLYHGLIEEHEAVEEPPQPDPTASEEATPDTTAPPTPTGHHTSLDALPSKPSAPETTPRKLVEKEERAKGAVLLSIYARYVSAAGGLPFAMLVVVIFLITNGFTILTSQWLQHWSSDVLTGHQKHSDQWWLACWAALWAVDLALETFKVTLLFWGTLRASRRLFLAMLDAILQAPLRFHDTVSRGRLLNRFGYDFEESDSEAAEAFERMGDEIITTIVNIGAVASGGGWTFVITFALMVPVYVLVGRLYITAVRDMKRLFSTTRSPILGTFTDVVTGAVVIRAFGASDYFFHTLVKRIDLNATFGFWTNELRWWYEQVFGTLSFFLILIAAIVILLNPSVGAARAGFVFTFLINTHIHLLFLLQSYTNMEQKLVSVERIVEYTKLEPEEKQQEQVTRVASSWPQTGAVQVDNLRVRYASELPEVLKGVTFAIPSGAKVGVVGPTGCGKSTLASSFFRFVDASAGSICIDGVDIATLPLKDLRSRLQIVPQDPIILSGPLRASVDVLDEYSDAEVRQALRDVQLVDGEGPVPLPTARNDFYNLQYAVAEGGSNLSNGEKQLLCLARAVLRRSKLIIFDEATSSVDFDTDQLIQTTIRSAFQDSTIITIAHRLRSIIDYDYVLVMDEGQVVEFDSPSSLLSTPSSRFYKLCKASGRRELAHLKSMVATSSL